MSFASASSFASGSLAVISSSVLFFKTTIVFDLPPAKVEEYAFVPRPLTVFVGSPCCAKLLRPRANSDAV